MKSLSLSKPHMIVMVGIPGSGKTFFAEKFAETFRAPYVSLEKIAGHLYEDQTAAEPIAGDQLHELLKTGQSVVVETATETRTGRAALAKKARANGYDTLFVWVQTDPTTAKTRATRPAKNSTNRIFEPEEYDRELKRFTLPSAIEKPVVISGKHTYATQAKVVLKRLSAPRAAISTHATPPVRPPQPNRRNISIR